jgi:hypothetical protein
MARNYIRPSKRNNSCYVWSNRKRDSLAAASQDDLLSRNGLRTERARVNASKTVHDIIEEYRVKGLGILGNF